MATAAIAAAAAGDNTVVAAVTGKRIRVRRFELSNGVATAQNAKFKSGAATDVTGLFYSAAVGPMGDAAVDDPDGRGYDFLFETAAGEALVLNLSAATAVGGFVNYSTV